MAFENLKTDGKTEEQGDFLGGAHIFESGVYPMRIDMAYQGLSKKGANSLVLVFKTREGKELRFTIWVTSSTEKGGTHYYVDKNGEQQYLPGFNQANSLARLTNDKELFQLITEDKVVNIYDFTARKEIPTTVPVFTELLDKDVFVGVIKQISDKRAKNASGEYVPTGETREENDVDKFFRASDGLTATEIKAGADHPEFMTRWKKKWEGQIRDRSVGVAKNAGTPGMPAGAGKTDTPSIF